MVWAKNQKRLVQLGRSFGFSLFIVLLSTHSGHAAHTPNCKNIRFSDVGWTDITATTAVASEILQALGYETRITQLSVPVTYMSLKNRDLDVFLGNWMPSMAADIAPYQKDGTVETLGAILVGARYSLAVPQYVYDAGVKSMADLIRFKDKFEGRVYGIEPGIDGNRLIQKMISENAFGLGSWKLVESSEQAMLMQVQQATRHQKWVLFLGWEPHPMNKKIKMAYLSGADQYFGPKQGQSTVYMNVRKNYSNECPKISRFLKNISFTVEMENQLMGMILDQKLEPKAAAKKWIASHPEVLPQWLKGVQSADGQDAMKVIQKRFAHD